MTGEDLIMAFFPCTRFECKVPLEFRGQAYQMKNWSDKRKLRYSMRLHEELHRNYELISMMAYIAIERGLRMVIENPWTQPHYLTSYWCLQPKVIDKNRREDGDYMKKPTQYWFIGMEPRNNEISDEIAWVEERKHDSMTNMDGKSRAVRRSEMHPQYANRFIRRYLIDT